MAVAVPDKRGPVRYPFVIFVSRCSERGDTTRLRTLRAHLRDAASVDARDLEAIALDIHRVADLGHPAETTEHQSADRVVRLILEREPELLAQIVERHKPVDHVRAGRLLPDALRLAQLELVAHLA